jgi:hypothetical protein
MIKRGAKGGDPYETSLNLFEWATKLVPNGKSMQYETRSATLAHEWDQMIQWKVVNYQGLDRDACPQQLAGIMKNLERGTQLVAIKYVEDGMIVSEISEALQMYAQEAARLYEEDLTLPVDAFRQPDAPWS